MRLAGVELRQSIWPQISISRLILATGNTSNTYSIRTIVTEAQTKCCHHRPMHFQTRRKPKRLSRREEKSRIVQIGGRKNDESAWTRIPRDSKRWTRNHRNNMILLIAPKGPNTKEEITARARQREGTRSAEIKKIGGGRLPGEARVFRLRSSAGGWVPF